MAEAGFYFVGSRKEPDLARCFLCLKELDGWESEDDPMLEHKKHAPYCQFIKLDKTEAQMSTQEHASLMTYRLINQVTRIMNKKAEEFNKQCEQTQAVIIAMVHPN